MKVAITIILAVVGLVAYLFLNVLIRRMVAGVRSREDYDEDVDGTMTDEEKQASEEAKVVELEMKKIGFGETKKEYGARMYAVAILGAALSGLAGWFFGLTPEVLIYFVFFALLTMIALIDLDTMEIPPVLNAIILGLGVISIFTNPEVTIVQRLIGFICISGFMFLVNLIVNGAFGGGDIKLMAAAGFLLGWKGVLSAFLIGIFVGAAVGIVLIARRKKGGKEHIPFGPSLCVGLVAAAILGGALIDWYLGMAKSMAHYSSY